MPQAVAGFLVQLGLSAALATAVASAIVSTAIAIGISFVSRLLFGGGSAKAETTERAVKTPIRSEEHTSELQSLMRISYAVFCLKKKTTYIYTTYSLKQN